MLEQLRRSTQSGYSYFLVAAVIIIFAFFFAMPRSSCSANNRNSNHFLASVAGDDVYSGNVNVIYNQVYGTRERGDDAKIQHQKALALKAYLMIDLLAHKAREAGLRVSDQEFHNYMKDPFRNPEFLGAYGQSGSWDGLYYKRYVQNLLRVSLPEYERFKRNEMLARKYLTMVEMQVNVLPQQIDHAEKIRNTKINLDFVKFDPAKLADFVQISDADVAQYEAKHAKDIQTYYDAHKKDYGTPAQMKVRRIYLEKGKKGPDGKSAEERFKLAKKRIDGGESFATVAGDINDALKAQQGLMDMTPVDNMNQDIVKALAGAKVGDVREVKTDSDMMLVKLLAKKDAVQKSLADVRDDVARKLLQKDRADALIDNLSKQLITKAQQEGTLKKALAALKPNADDEANANNPPKSAWSAVEVEQTGDFTLEGKDMSAMFGGQLPPGLSLGRTPWDRIPKIGQSRRLAVDAFSKLTDKKPLADKPYVVDNAKVVVELESKTTADEAANSAKAKKDDTKKDDASGDEDELTPAQKHQQFVQEIRGKEARDLVGQWQRLFRRRTRFGPSLTMDYGPWLEKQYENAVKKGVIELSDNGGQVVAMVDPTGTAVSASAITGGKGSPMKITPSKAPKAGAKGAKGTAKPAPKAAKKSDK